MRDLNVQREATGSRLAAMLGPSATVLMIALYLVSPASADTMQFEGNAVFYEEHGTGDPVVLIHGYGANGAVWDEVVEALSEGHRVIVPDLLGFDRSARPLIDYDAGLYARLIVSLMDHLEVPEADLIGNSMGGWVSMLVASREPDRVRSLVLAAPAFYRGLPAEVSADDLATGALPATREGYVEYLDRVYFAPPEDLETIDEMYAANASANDMHVLESLATAFKAGRDVLSVEAIGAIAQPTLLLQGDGDGVVEPDATAELATTLPDARLMTFPDAGHWIQVEQPAAFLRSVLAFLNRDQNSSDADRN